MKQCSSGLSKVSILVCYGSVMDGVFTAEKPAKKGFKRKGGLDTNHLPPSNGYLLKLVLSGPLFKLHPFQDALLQRDEEHGYITLNQLA